MSIELEILIGEAYSPIFIGTCFIVLSSRPERSSNVSYFKEGFAYPIFTFYGLELKALYSRPDRSSATSYFI